MPWHHQGVSACWGGGISQTVRTAGARVPGAYGGALCTGLCWGQWPEFSATASTQNAALLAAVFLWSSDLAKDVLQSLWVV